MGSLRPLVVVLLIFMGSSVSTPAPQGLAELVYRAPPEGNRGLEGSTVIYRRSHAIVIGISDYDSLPDLPGATRDAEAVAGYLRKAGFLTTVLLDREATRERIARLLGDELPQHLEPEDRALIYFAGHGVTVGEGKAQMGYLMPVGGSNEMRVATGISMRELQAWLATYSAKHVMFVADACFSGLALATRSAGMSTTLADYLRRVTEERVRLTITAGRADQEAHEWRGQGLFTFFLLEGLQGAADGNDDGIVTSAELYAYVEPNVAQTALAHWKAEQNPRLGRSGQGEFVFLTARQTLGSGSGVAEVEPLSARAGETDPDVSGPVRIKAPPRETRAIAILPFANTSGDPQQAYLNQGIADSIAAELGTIGALRVTSRTSAMRFLNSARPIPEIARAHGVDYILEGGAAQNAGRARVTVRLISAAADEQLWSDLFDRELADLPALYTEVARHVAQRVRITLTPAERTRLARARSSNAEAQDLYLKGLEHYGRPPKGLIAAREYFEQALEEDPSSPEIHTMLARTYQRSAQAYLGPAEELWELAKTHATRAVELDPQYADARAALATVLSNYELKWFQAGEELERALALNPSDTAARLSYVTWLSAMERHDEAIAHARILVELDPLSSFHRHQLAARYYHARRYKEATKHFEDAIELDVDNPYPYSYMALIALFRGQAEEAIRLQRKSDRLLEMGDSGWLGYILARGGSTPEARRILSTMESRIARGEILSRAEVGLIHAGLGEADEAFTWLEKSFAHYDQLLWQLQDPVWDPIRDDPRFERIIRRRRGLEP